MRSSTAGPEIRRIHFVGVGAMGSAMVRHLRRPAIELRITDADDDRARAIADELAAVWVPTDGLVGAVGDAEVVVLMLPNTDAVESVLLGDRGGLAALPPGAVVIDMGSSDPRATRTNSTAAAVRGIGYVDAPVSGGVRRAVTAELSIMVGGAADDFDRVRDLLGYVGTDIEHLGPSGSGHAMKALNNLLSAIGLLGASEVIAVGREFGLDPHTMVDVLNRSSGANDATRVKMARYALSGAFDSAFSMELMVKDLRTAIGIAGAVGIDASLGRRCLETWQEADQLLGPGADHTQIWGFVESQTGESGAPDPHR